MIWNDRIFQELDQLGHPHLDTVLFESRYPVLFTCVNAEKEVFLCICCRADADLLQWIVSPTEYPVLIGLLTDQITIRDAFLRGSALKYVVECRPDACRPSVRTVPAAQMDEDLLPTAGEFMEAEDGEYAEEIALFQKRAAALRAKKPDTRTFSLLPQSLTVFSYQMKNPPSIPQSWQAEQKLFSGQTRPRGFCWELHPVICRA